MALCLDGILTKPTIEAKLTPIGLSASLSYNGLSGSMERNSVIVSLDRKFDVNASIEERRTFDNYELSSRLAVKATISHRKSVRAVLSCNTHSATLATKLGSTATLNAKDFMKASMRRNGVDSYFTIFCPIDYLKACFSNGWNNDAGWDNDAGWSND